MNRLKDYFHFQKEEKIAFFFLVGIIVSVIAYINIDSRIVDEEVQDFSEFEEKTKAFEASISESAPTEKSKKKASPASERTTKSYTLFPFDPNGLAIESWMKLGLSKAQAKVIKKYEKKGGRFYDKEDVKKMYTISDQKYAELEPYIKIDQSQFEEKWDDAGDWERTYFDEEEVLYFDLNIVDSINLLKLRGIGPSFSSRILEFKNNLGGFTNKEQLLEFWGLESIRYSKIKESVFVDTNFAIRKININSASAEEMKDHPYISWNVANSIEKYREQNGKYQKLEEIKESHLIDDSLYNKLLPYLKL